MGTKERFCPKPQPEIQRTPFDSVEEAWFWFIQAQKAREDGARFSFGQGLVARPCEPIDILNVLNGLYRTRRLLMDHLRVLRFYGDRQMSPDPRRQREMLAHDLWCEAMDRIEPILIRKGIVHGASWCREVEPCTTV